MKSITHCGSIGLVQRKTQLYNVCIMEDKYEGLSDEELKEIFEDMEADYWIDYYKSVYE